VNASTVDGAVEAYNGATQLGADVAVQSATPCGTITLEPGSKTISFRSDGSQAEIASTGAFTFQANRDYLVVLMAGPARAVVLEEQAFPSPSGADNAVRIVNATATDGDVYVTVPAATPVVANKITVATGASTTSSVYRHFASTLIQARMFDVGATTFTSPRANYTLVATGGNRTTTLFLTPVFVTSPAPPAQPASVSGFQVNRCT